MYRLRTIGLAGVLTIIVAACSSSPSSSSSASATPIPTATPTVAATPSAEASGSEVALPSIDLPHNAAELEALLPDKVGDVPMVKTSSTGKDFVTNDAQDNKEFTDFLSRLGASLDDVSVATASPDFQSNPELAADPSKFTLVFAFRVAGANSDRLQTELETAMASGSSGTVDWAQKNIGGKNVDVAALDDAQAGGTTYVYTFQDITFAVIAASEQNAATVLSHLP